MTQGVGLPHPLLAPARRDGRMCYPFRSTIVPAFTDPSVIHAFQPCEHIRHQPSCTRGLPNFGLLTWPCQPVVFVSLSIVISIIPRTFVSQYQGCFEDGSPRSTHQ